MEKLPAPNIIWSAGENSGDFLASEVLPSVMQEFPEIEMDGIGGDRMIQSGLTPWFHAKDLSVRGYIEVIKHLPRILKIRSQMLRRVTKMPPNAFIGVDAPDFNLAIEERARSKGVPVIHMVAPAVWAWRPNRIHQIKRAVDHLLLIFPFEKEIFDKASEILGFSMPELCFEKNDRLDITEYTQPAMVTASIAMMKVFMERTGITPSVAAGLSLGEYPAMAAAGVMSAEDAIRTVRQRGILMQEAVPAGVGAMSAVLAMDGEKIEEVIAPIDGVQIANYNCPGQIVISGKKEAVDEAAVKFKEAGAKRVLPLNVSGPFHSSLLEEAGEKLGEVLAQVEVHTPVIPYIANVTAGYVTDAGDVKPLLIKQVSSSVRWEQSIRRMLEDGVDTFIEIGPGRTLTGFMKKIDRNAKAMNIEKLEDIEKVKEALGC